MQVIIQNTKVHSRRFIRLYIIIQLVVFSKLHQTNWFNRRKPNFFFLTANEFYLSVNKYNSYHAHKPKLSKQLIVQL